MICERCSCFHAWPTIDRLDKQWN